MKKGKFKNLIILIRFILLSIALTLIYLLVWHFAILIINNEDVTFWSKVIFAIFGFNIVTYYENSINMDRKLRFVNGENLRITYNFKIPFILKIVITPIAIPLFISTYVCDWITEHIYKDEIAKEEKAIHNYKNISNLNYNTNFNYDNSFKEEYYCEMCFKKITEEEYENFDGMCEECFEAENFDNL